MVKDQVPRVPARDAGKFSSSSYLANLSNRALLPSIYIGQTYENVYPNPILGDIGLEICLPLFYDGTRLHQLDLIGFLHDADPEKHGRTCVHEAKHASP